LFNATMTKPRNNNPTVDKSPTSDEDTDEETQDDGLPNGSSDRSGTNEQETVRLLEKLTAERKKRYALKQSVKRLRERIQTCNATRLATAKKLKGQLDGMKIKEQSAVDAASTSSKIVDDATKEAIGTKSERIRDQRKEISDLKKQVNNSKALQEKVDRLKADVNALITEKNAWKKERQALSRDVKSLKTKVSDQAGAKYAHQQKMAEIALEGKHVVLEQGKQKQANLEARNRDEIENKKEYKTWTIEQGEIQKDNAIKRKDAAKDKKTKQVADRLQVVSSDMLRTNQQKINGGAFPSPGTSLQEVSNFISASKRMHLF
jgi:hypothetical protein